MKRFLKTLFFVFLVTAVFSQSTIVTDFIRRQKPALPPNCQEVDSKNFCIQCIEGYMVLNGKCAPLPLGCLQADDNNRCLKCAEGYLVSKGLCVKKDKPTLPPNCLQAVGNQCIRCIDNWVFNENGQCVKYQNIGMPQNCLQVDNFNRCIKCVETYSVSYGQCIKNQKPSLPPKCLQVDNKNNCVKCNEGYSISKGLCVPYNCIRTDSLSRCLQCDEGYLVTDDLCKPILFVNCVQGDKYNCFKCASGYQLSNGKCIKNQKPSLPPKCLQVDNKNNCLKCDEGYLLSEGLCTKIDKPVLPTNCLQAVGNQCIMCIYEWILNQYNQCVMYQAITMPQYCSKVDNSNRCLKCFQGFSLEQNTCVKRLKPSYPPWCLKVDNNNRCLQCDEAYLVSNGLCLPYYCTRADSLSRCLQCNEGYFIGNRWCRSIVPTNCIIGHMDGYNCIRCAYGYQISNGKCIEKTINISPTIPPNCLQADSQNKCVKCDWTFSVSKGLCLPYNCMKADSLGHCIQCIEGYAVSSLTNGQCTKITKPNLPPNCIQADRNNRCVQCAEGYFVSNGFCGKVTSPLPPPHCIRADPSFRFCLQCQENYIVADYLCKPILPANCVQGERYKCLQCAPGYDISNGQCTKITKPNLPPNCIQADRNNRCVQCVSGYSLSQFKCVMISDSQFDPINPPASDPNVDPCGNQDSCGQIKKFKNDQQFKAFSSKFAKPKIQPALYCTTGCMSSGPRRRNSSPTNNQVKDVDQSDLLKTDGTYIYTISDRILSIILAYPANRARVVSIVNLTNFNSTSLLIQDDYLAVFGTNQDVNLVVDDPFSGVFTFIKIFDITNRASPFEIKQYKVTGQYLDGRKLSNGFIYVLTKQPFSDMTKIWYDFGSGKKNIPSSAIFAYSDSFDNPSLFTTTAINLRNPINGQKKVIALIHQQTNLLYISDGYIYLASTVRQSGVDYTKIRKIYIKNNFIKPFADGKILGTVNNQFSLDQSSKFLRVLTTSRQNQVVSNNVFVLDYNLRPYGSLTGFAQGDKIYSARFVGTRCYVSTFSTQNPFIVISLRNNRRPLIMGQVQIQGFSRYLHAYDENTIVGLGHATTSNNQQLGIKIEIYDVSDVTNPQIRSHFEIAQTFAQSTAQFEHKAFLLAPQKNLLVIPASMQDSSIKFNGAFAFQITSDFVDLKGVIHHYQQPAGNFQSSYVERSLYIERLLYTKSSCLLKINKINDIFEDVTSFAIPCQQQ